MGTPITEIVDQFMMLQEDYILLTKFQTSGSSIFNTYLEPWLLNSIREFEGVCTQDLTYSTDTQEFQEDLTEEHKLILSQIMIKYWLFQKVQNVLQWDNNIIDKDFRMFSQAENLKEKRNYLNSKKEEISQILSDYALKHNSWTDWANQNFGDLQNEL